MMGPHAHRRCQCELCRLQRETDRVARLATYGGAEWVPDLPPEDPAPDPPRPRRRASDPPGWLESLVEGLALVLAALLLLGIVGALVSLASV